MPGKKRKTKGNKSSIDRTSDVSHVHPTADGETAEDFQLHVPRESQFSGFLDGLRATSSPGNGFSQRDERKRLTLHIAEEQRHIVEESINVRFGGLLDLLDKPEAKTAVWVDGDLIDVVKNLVDANNAEERKVTWAETPHPTQTTWSTRDTRRSKSVDPTARHAGNRTQRLSAGHSYPELKTPSVSERFRYNIATVTPHPKQETVSFSSILRKPKFGETAISMAGSPLLVSTDHVSVPSVVVPMRDGRVFNVQGNNSSFNQKMREGLDQITINQLKDLKDFISDLVP